MVDTLTNSRSATSGLATWRKRQAEDKERRMAELAELRKSATVEVRDGRKFKVVKIPDRYDEVERIEPPVQLRGPKRKQNAA